MATKQTHHFVLIHGACNGAWCWYMLKPLLESAGHRVTLLDMAASGIDMKPIQQVKTIAQYTEPLLHFLASLQPNVDEKVVLVGHSLGGVNLAVAMDRFPEKIAVAVFLTAFMPDNVNRPSFVLDQYNERTPAEAWLDTQQTPYSNSEEHLLSMFFGPKFLSKLYHLNPIQHLELAKTLVRPGSLFSYDLANISNFSVEGYGSVARVFVVANEDKGIPLEFQRWMIENNPPHDVMEIKQSDHMVMLSKPQEVCDCLIKIGSKYA